MWGCGAGEWLSVPELIVVISDGSALLEGLDSVLSGYARWLRRFGFNSCTVAVNADVFDASSVLSGVHADVSVVYLVHTRGERAWQIRQALEGSGRVVVTDTDLLTVVTATRVLTELRLTGRPVEQSGVVVAGSDELFEMAPLLIAIGFRNLMFWRRADASSLPLAHMARDADVVVDLCATPVEDPRTSGQASPLIVRLPALADCVAVLPGLLTALIDTRAGQLHVDVLAAVAQMLAATAAPRATWATPAPALTDSIAWAARHALCHPRGR
jgi:hypothetical protein